MNSRGITCLLVFLVLLAGGLHFQAWCVAEMQQQPEAEPDVAALLPAHTLAYARIVNVDEIVPALILSPAFRDETILGLFRGVQDEIVEELAEIGFPVQGMQDLVKAVKTLHLAIVGINYDEEFPLLVGVLELTDPEVGRRVLAYYGRQAEARGIDRRYGRLKWDYRGTPVYRLADSPIYLASVGSRLIFAFDPFDLKILLLGRKPDASLAQVPVFQQLRKRYESSECFVFGNARQGLRLLCQNMDIDDVAELNAVDNAFGLCDVRAVGIGSRIEVKPDEAAMEVTVVLDEGSPTLSALRGAALDPTRHLQMLPKGCFFGLFGNLADPADTWSRAKQLLGTIDEGEFLRAVEKIKKDGFDIDELARMLSGPIGMFYVPREGRPSGTVVMAVGDDNPPTTLLQRIAEANPTGNSEGIGKFKGQAFSLGSFVTGPGYAFIGSDDLLAVRRAIAATENKADRDTALIRTISAIGGGTATKVFFFDPAAAPDWPHFRKLAPAPGVDFRWVVTSHEEKDDLILRTNVSAFTLVIALILLN